jgi:integrase
MWLCLVVPIVHYGNTITESRTAHGFAQIAAVTREDLGRHIDAARGKTAYDSEVSCIERHFLPYFGDWQFEQLTHQDMVNLEWWRDRQMAKKPRAATLMNFASVWNRWRETAVRHGWISPNAKIPVHPPPLLAITSPGASHWPQLSIPRKAR